MNSYRDDRSGGQPDGGTDQWERALYAGDDVMDAKIIALTCPTCGNSATVNGKDAGFGFQFTCAYCGTHAVLVINQQLYVPKPHEHVCRKCGRVASPGARFCQCRASLVRPCWNCQAEIPVDDEVCNQCGRSRIDYENSDEKRLMDCVEAEVLEAERKAGKPAKRDP